MAAQGTPPDDAQTTGDSRTELNRRVFRASHSRIPEIVELARKIRRHGPDILGTIEAGLFKRQARGVRQQDQGHHPHGLRLPPREQSHRACHAPPRRTRHTPTTTKNPTPKTAEAILTFLRREGGVTAALRCENARLRSWALTVEPAIMAQATIATRRY